MAKKIDARSLHARLEGDQETALIDVREQAPFAASHPILAANIPLAQLELLAGERIPRLSTPIIVEDGGEGIAEQAAAKLEAFGYTDVSVLDGGTPAWQAAGLELFSGMYVPSKAFGEFVEHAYGTPSVSAEELKAIMDSGRKLVVLDSRPMDEFRVMNIPSGIDVPGAELVYRVGEVAPEPDTLVVVNCAGRTRSIIGAQSLINAGVENKVVALQNGTMGWHLSGFELERGNHKYAAEALSAGTVEKAKARAAAVAARFEVPEVDQATLDSWMADESRTTFLLDVRHPHEFEAGRMPGAISAPGGQLVQATDRYAGVRGARLVLVDDGNLVRARMTAHWLVQMHWDAYVLAGGLPETGLESGKRPLNALGMPDVEMLDAASAKAKLGAGWVAVDVATSRDYRLGHIPGAWWSTRARLAAAAKQLPDATGYVATSEDGVVARYAAAELAALTGKPTAALDGGTAAWQAAGLALEAGETHHADEPDDVWLKPYERKGVVEDFMREYLTWEIDLIKQIERDDLVSFRSY